jgi:hypothetical protein
MFKFFRARKPGFKRKVAEVSEQEVIDDVAEVVDSGAQVASSDAVDSDVSGANSGAGAQDGAGADASGAQGDTQGDAVPPGRIGELSAELRAAVHEALTSPESVALAHKISIQTAGNTESVGEYLGFDVMGDTLVSHYHEAKLEGYAAWRWLVVLSLVPEERPQARPGRQSAASVGNEFRHDAYGGRMTAPPPPPSGLQPASGVDGLTPDGHADGLAPEDSHDQHAGASLQPLVTVVESTLVPGEESLLPPEWVPWSKRLTPSDISEIDELPYEKDDSRLAIQRTLSKLDVQVLERLALQRNRVLNLYGKSEAAARWYEGSHGPFTASTRVAQQTCMSCGFYVPLAGDLGQMFGVCANTWSRDDGKVVSTDHGCGMHSETDIQKGYKRWNQSPPAFDEQVEIIDDDQSPADEHPKQQSQQPRPKQQPRQPRQPRPERSLQSERPRRQSQSQPASSAQAQSQDAQAQDLPTPTPEKGAQDE